MAAEYGALFVEDLHADLEAAEEACREEGQEREAPEGSPGVPRLHPVCFVLGRAGTSGIQGNNTRVKSFEWQLPPRLPA